MSQPAAHQVLPWGNTWELKAAGAPTGHTDGHTESLSTETHGDGATRASAGIHGHRKSFVFFQIM